MVSQSVEASHGGASGAPDGSGAAAVAVSNISQPPEEATIAIYQAGKRQQLKPTEQYEISKTNDSEQVRAHHIDRASKQFNFSKLIAALDAAADGDGVGVLLSLSRAGAGNFFALAQDNVEVGYDGQQGIIRVFGAKEAVMAFLGEVYFYGNPQALQHFYVDVKILSSSSHGEFSAISSASAREVSQIVDARVFMLYESGSGFYVSYQGSGSSGVVPAGSDLVTIATPEGPLAPLIMYEGQVPTGARDVLFESADAPAVSAARNELDPDHLLGAVTNAAPNAVDDVFATKVSSALSINVAGVAPAILSNDSDPNNNALAITAIAAGSAGGALADNGNGTFTYTPPALFIGVETFEYTL